MSHTTRSRAALLHSLPLLLLAYAQGVNSSAQRSSDADVAQPADSSSTFGTQAVSVRDTQSDTWAGTDALGRNLPMQDVVGTPRAGKFVGLFYHLWEPGEKVYDITKITAGQATWGPRWSFHWWGEPYFGYYYRDDEYVIRKHAQLLTDAGVDTLILDFSNGLAPTKKDFGRLLKLCEVYTRMRSEGLRTPQLSFLTGDNPQASGETLNYLYENFYRPGRYSGLWFRWYGKPLMLANTQNVPQATRDFFTLRRSWAWSNPNGWFGDGHDRWPWLDTYPQRPGWHSDTRHLEEITVGVAQHPVTNIGRSFHAGSEPSIPTPSQGLYFAEQWKRALAVDPEFVFITGWNEWIAQRFIYGTDRYRGPLMGKALKNGDSYFIDAYNEEYSRDIEPMLGGHGDDYYYQMVDGIRRFKGVRAVSAPGAQKTMTINTNFDQWRGVGPIYTDDIGDTVHRDRPGSAQRTYRDDTGRNDLAVMQVARDRDRLYFYARTAQPLTAPGNNWMTLYLKTDGSGSDGWNGFDWAVNRVIRNATTSVLEHFVNGSWHAVMDVKFAYVNNKLQLSLPRNTLGLGTARGPLDFDFKWADNGPVGGDAIGFLNHGDAAPNGRFAYRYQESAITPTMPPPPPAGGN